MVTRESTLRESFDPAAFHRATEMTQAGWAEREVRHAKSGVGYNLARFSSSITFFLGALVVLLLRPIDIMDGRDVLVSSVAIGACWLVAAIATKVTMSLFRTTVEVDRVVAWSLTLLLAMVVASTGVVAEFSDDVDDYIANVPGHTLTASSPTEANKGSSNQGTFSDIGSWKLDRGGETTGSVNVFMVSDQARDLSERVLFARALHERSDLNRRERIAGRSVMVARVSGLIQLGWRDGDALIVVSGASRDMVDPAAKALLKH